MSLSSQSPASGSFPATLLTMAQQLTEETSRDLFGQIQLAAVPTLLRDGPVTTAYVTNAEGSSAEVGSAELGQGTDDAQGASSPRQLPPLLLLHGFDSSLLEFRRLYPLLAAEREVWLIDFLGFGFSDRPTDIPLSPESLKIHLLAFWKQKIKRPVVLIGASMGGAAAIDFATTHPETVEQLVLLDSAGYQNGPIIGRYLFHPLDQWAVEFLRKPEVRRRISCNAYADPDRLVTLDAQCCAALHLQMPRWDQALKAFTKSGGYPKMRDRLPKVASPTLILWGKQDRILGTKDAAPMAEAIPNSQLDWIDNSGHVPHLEQPEATATAILSFARPSAVSWG